MWLDAVGPKLSVGLCGDFLLGEYGPVEDLHHRTAKITSLYADPLLLVELHRDLRRVGRTEPTDREGEAGG